MGRWTSGGCASPITMWEQLQVEQFVFRCMVCDQIRASFNAPTPHLQPLPIMGLGYWWSLDFASPLSLTPWHNQYVLVMIEHFSKWLELVPLLDCSSERTTYAFLDKVLSRFGALVKILTYQGTKFHGEFQELCEKTLIDHCMTSWDHPKVNRLIERMV